MIKDGSRDASKMHRLLDKGADYKYIDPEKAKRGFTFANVMQDAGSQTLLKALRNKRGGVHETGHEAPEPAGP
jgi:hypothetical protein